MDKETFLHQLKVEQASGNPQIKIEFRAGDWTMFGYYAGMADIEETKVRIEKNLNFYNIRIEDIVAVGG